MLAWSTVRSLLSLVQLQQSLALRGFVGMLLEQRAFRRYFVLEDVCSALLFTCEQAVHSKQTDVLPKHFQLLLQHRIRGNIAEAWKRTYRAVRLDLLALESGGANSGTAHCAADLGKLRFETERTFAFKSIVSLTCSQKRWHNVAPYRIQQVVAPSSQPSDPMHAAIWREFQWTKPLFNALHSGVAQYRQWLTDVTGEAALWQRFQDEYHHLEWYEDVPGQLVGSRLQAQCDGEWRDIAAASVEEHVGPVRVFAQYVPHGADVGGGSGVLEQFVALLVRAPANLRMIGRQCDEMPAESLPLANGSQPTAEIDGGTVRCMSSRLLESSTMMTLTRLDLLVSPLLASWLSIDVA